MTPRPLVVVVTGMSGAGKSTALHALEDLGFFCIDNLPTVLAPQAVALCEHGGMTRIALGIDARVRAFLGEVGNVLAMLEGGAHPASASGDAGSHPASHSATGDPRGGQREVQVLFLDASDEMLLRRFSETRRRHPLDTSGGDGAGPVIEGIRLERERLAGLRARATRVFDTTLLSVHELRRALIAHFGPAADGTPQRMRARIVSFGFKYGAPVDADLVLDVRFLENPYFVPELTNLPGTDPAVAAFVNRLPETKEFVDKTLALLSFVLPKYEREGKSYLTIGIGCTGGRHRSVVIAEALAEALASRAAGRESHVTIELVHRDVMRKAPALEPAPRGASNPESGAMPAAELAPIAEEASELKHALSPLPQPVHQSFRPPTSGGASGGPR